MADREAAELFKAMRDILIVEQALRGIIDPHFTDLLEKSRIQINHVHERLKDENNGK